MNSISVQLLPEQVVINFYYNEPLHISKESAGRRGAMLQSSDVGQICRHVVRQITSNQNIIRDVISIFTKWSMTTNVPKIFI